jgi:hypothetical protein
MGRVGAPTGESNLSWLADCLWIAFRQWGPEMARAGPATLGRPPGGGRVPWQARS